MPAYFKDEIFHAIPGKNKELSVFSSIGHL
jgi:hypothetical protein